MLLGEIVQKYREEHHLSQRQFAMKCGISNGYISMIEKNENPATGKPVEVSLPKLKAIANAMNISADELMRITDGDTLVSLEAENVDTSPAYVTKTKEARILGRGIDKMPEADRQRAIEMVKLMFDKYADYFERSADDES